MQAKTALKCKSLGKEIRNCDSAKWNSAAAEECYPGILSKFQQNAGIASFLKNTGSKTLLECCYNDVWGNSIPLSNPDCINPSEYKSQGILGSMLEQVRESLLNPIENCTKDTSNRQNPTSSQLNDSMLPHSSTASALHVETNPHT